MNAVQADFMAAEQACANAINQVHGGAQLVSAGSSEALADGSNVYAVDAGTLDGLGQEGKLPWGRPAEYAHSKGWAGAAEGAVDGAWGLFTGVYSLTGLANWWRPHVDALNLSTPTSNDAWAGVFAIGSAVSVMTSPAGRLPMEVVNASQTLLSVGKQVIRYEAWAAGDWEYAVDQYIFRRDEAHLPEWFAKHLPEAEWKATAKTPGPE